MTILTYLQYSKQEQLNEYARTNVRETFAEYFRASTDTRWSTVDPKYLSPREHAQQQGPTVIDYLARIQIAAELLLERDANAFTPESNVDVRLEVVERALVSTMKQIPVIDVSIDELTQRRDAFRERIERDTPSTTASRHELHDFKTTITIGNDVFHVDGQDGSMVIGHLGNEPTLLEADLFPANVKAGDAYNVAQAENGDVTLSKIAIEQDAADFALER